ncbi:hypothetical protein [Rufibacter immobilis]|nr:hypothetical protein [Rufibacter immobilis]
MKKLAAFSSIFALGALGIWVSSLLSPHNLSVDLSDEDIHLYL